MRIRRKQQSSPTKGEFPPQFHEFNELRKRVGTRRARNVALAQRKAREILLGAPKLRKYPLMPNVPPLRELRQRLPKRMTTEQLVDLDFYEVVRGVAKRGRSIRFQCRVCKDWFARVYHPRKRPYRFRCKKCWMELKLRMLQRDLTNDPQVKWSKDDIDWVRRVMERSQETDAKEARKVKRQEKLKCV